jgi:hypothetical protein
MKIIFNLAVIMVLVSGCVTNPKPNPKHNLNRFKGVTEKQVAENRARPYTQGMLAFKKYMLESDCNSENVKIIKSGINDLEKQVKIWSGLRVWRAREVKTRGWHTGLAFNFADESLKKGCLDNADITYRSLVNFYVGGAYVGIRDRAKIGIDDVRSEKKQ